MRTDIRYLAIFVLVMALPLVLGSGCSTSNQSGASAPSSDIDQSEDSGERGEAPHDEGSEHDEGGEGEESISC